jgi:D-3-phosphoglycerate dehydrogenase
MGKFQGNIISGGLKQVSVEFSGEITEYDTSPVTVSLLKGLLDPILEDDINFVNAAHVAKERGVEVIESKASLPKDYTQLIKVTAKTDQMESTIEGTIFGLSDPRIVKINQFELECVPEGHIIYIQNNDKPGIIGSIGKALGDHAINIARMQVGRDKEAEKALIILNTDSAIPVEIIEELKSIGNILDVHQLEI